MTSQERSSCLALLVRDQLASGFCDTSPTMCLAPTALRKLQPRKVAPVSRSSSRGAPIRTWTSALCMWHIPFFLSRAPLLIEQRTLRPTGVTPWQATRSNWGSSPPSLCKPSRWNILDNRTHPPSPRLTEPSPPPQRSLTLKARSAHAGYAPWEGVNALDAAFVAYAGISALRQQIRPEQRVHGVISGRDWAPNGSFPFFSFQKFLPPLVSLSSRPLPQLFHTGKKRVRGK